MPVTTMNENTDRGRPDFDPVAPLLGAIREAREEIEREARIPDAIIAGMKDAGVYRAAVPERFGGEGRPIRQLLELTERISAADGSVGWVATFGTQMASFLGSMTAEGLSAYYAGGPDQAAAGALFPVQGAQRHNDTITVRSRWRFASGSPHADWIGVGVKLAEDEREFGKMVPRVALLKPNQLEIVPNWDVVGLGATGSHDLVVEDAQVPLSRIFLRNAPAAYPEPIYLIPPVALTAMLFGAVAAGIARDSLDEFYALASGKVSLAGGSRVADKPVVQIKCARAEYELRAARAYLLDEAEEAWREILETGSLPHSRHVNLRVSAIHLTEAAVQATTTAFRLAGTTAVYRSHPLQRHLRDVNAVAQHAFLNPDLIQKAGQVLLGSEVSPGFP